MSKCLKKIEFSFSAHLIKSGFYLEIHVAGNLRSTSPWNSLIGYYEK
jgi:hypothetical protein